MDKETFIQKVAEKVRKYAPLYGISVHSPIIAQAIIESGWGKSGLASKYHNYFGLKCGSSWKGGSVNMTTREEYKPGVVTNIRDNFRTYEDFDAGIRGYFEFIKTSRYANLKGVKSPEEYVRRIKADGYATSSKYVDNIMRVIRDNKLTRFDGNGDDDMKKEELTGKVLSGEEIIDILAKRVINGDYGAGTERKAKLGELYSIVQKRVNKLC
jgi:flagellum-specific peptidoglycan hydrolase FlgJ